MLGVKLNSREKESADDMKVESLKREISRKPFISLKLINLIVKHLAESD